MEREKLALYFYEKYQILVSKVTFDYSEKNLDKCFERQVEWDNLKHENSSLLKLESCK